MVIRVGAVIVLAVAGSAACSPVYLAHGPAISAAPAIPGSRAVERTSSTSSGAAPATGALSSILGSLVWPLAIDRQEILSSPYGVRPHPAGGAPGRFHGGLDLRAREGTPIYAVADGRVVQSGSGGAYGNVIIVDHGAELASLYGHNRVNLVREGDPVRRGEVIALVGRTGNATGDHLHFELRWRGGTVDPRVVLPRLGAAPGP